MQIARDFPPRLDSPRPANGAGEARLRLERARRVGDYSTALGVIDALRGRGAEGVPALVEAALAGEPGGFLGRVLRCRAVEALRRGAAQDDMAVGTFIAVSRDPDAHVAAVAAAALGDCVAQRERASRALRPLADHPSPLVRHATAGALARLAAA